MPALLSAPWHGHLARNFEAVSALSRICGWKPQPLPGRRHEFRPVLVLVIVLVLVLVIRIGHGEHEQEHESRARDDSTKPPDPTAWNSVDSVHSV